MMRPANCLSFLAACALVIAIGPARRTLHAQEFNPQPDPPGFGLVGLHVGETIVLNVVCFEHAVGALPPGPCRGVLMFHNGAGATLGEKRYDLLPGQSARLRFTRPATVGDVSPAARVNIIPCVLPAPGSGFGIPSVELFDTNGRLAFFENPASPKMSEFNNGLTDPGSIVGFNPQPDPPGFGLVTVRTDQIIRLNVACFEHNIGAIPPGPCRGEMMFHNAAGDVVARGAYDLQPGEVAVLRFNPPPEPGTVASQINPCILPSPGGRAVPNVEVLDGATHQTLLLINPAAARMSMFGGG
jgi:hypothetical protein